MTKWQREKQELLDYFEQLRGRALKKDADRFFGRERFLEEDLWPAFEALARTPPWLLALVGPSGSGKSSVARGSARHATPDDRLPRLRNSWSSWNSHFATLENPPANAARIRWQ